MMGPAELERVLAFLRAAERLKATDRSALTSTGRRESAAEHKWRAGLAVAMAGVVATAACADAFAPGHRDLAGRWDVTDTVSYRYVMAADGSTRTSALTFNVTIDIWRTGDTSYRFHAVDGTQTTYDTIAGQAQPPVTSSQDGMWGYVFVAGDTARVTILGTLDLTGATDDAIASRGYLPTPECLANLGGLARPSPAPSCLHTHNWSRVLAP